MRRAFGVFVVLGVAMLGCGDDDGGGPAGGIATTEALREALASASAGQTLTLAAATFEGPFDVPAGVILRGAGRDQTRVHVGPEQIGLRIRSGAGRTELRALSVLNDGRAGILAIGADAIQLADVSVNSTGPGVAIGVEDTPLVIFNDVTVQGPVTPESPTALERVPAFGVVLIDVGLAEPPSSLTNLSARGFVESGVSLIRTTIGWTGGGVEGGFGQGISVFGGNVELTDIRVAGQMRTTDLEHPTYGIAAVGGAMLDTDGVTVDGVDGFGLYHGDVSVLHTALGVTGGTDASVWLQAGADVTLQGATIDGGQFAAIAAVGITQLVVEDAMLSNVAQAMRLGDMSSVTVGDGIHIVESATEPRLANARFDRVVLANNARVGFLADLAGISSDVLSFADVVVRGPETSFGALCQNGEIAEGWDTGLSREGALVARDVDAPELEPSPALATTDLPSFPGSDANGIAGLIGPPD